MMPNRISLLFYFCFFKRLYWQDWQNKNVTYLIHPLHPSCIFSGLGSGWEVGVGGSSCWTTVGTWNDHQSFIFFHQKDFIKQYLKKAILNFWNFGQKLIIWIFVYRWQSRSGRNSRVRRFMSDFECIIRWLVMIIDGMTSFVILFTTWWHFLFLKRANFIDRDWRSHCGPRSDFKLQTFATVSIAEHYWVAFRSNSALPCWAAVAELSSVSRAEQR